MKLLKNRKGLTLIELLIVVIILGALAAIAIPRIAENSVVAKERACETNIATINTQIELFYSENEVWPTDLTTDVLDEPNYFPDGIPACPSGGTYTMSGTTHRVDCDEPDHGL